MFRIFHSRKPFVVIALILTLFMCTIFSADAQRTMKGQHAIGVEAAGYIPNLGNLGVNLNYSQYLLSAYWMIDAFVGSNQINVTGGIPMNFIEYALGGGYMYRLLATRSRSISLYAGGGAFIGYELYDPMKKLPASIDTELPTGNFLYGVSPRIEAEFFVIRQLAITVGTVAMVNFSSPLVMFRPQLRLGLRYDI